MKENRQRLNLDLDLLRTFVIVADLNTFGAAAAAISRTQSAVSQQMQRLETLVSKPLFMRHGRNKLLTEEGTQLLAFARRILKYNDRACQALETQGAEGRVVFRIADEAAEIFFTTPLNVVRTLYPKLMLDLSINSDPFEDRGGSRGQNELIVTTQAPASHKSVLLRQQPTLWCCARHYRFNPEKPLPLIVSSTPRGYSEMLMAHLTHAGFTWYISHVASTLSATRSALLAGLGISAWPAMSAIDESLRILGAEEGLPGLEDTRYFLCLPHQSSGDIAQNIFDVFSVGAMVGQHGE